MSDRQENMTMWRNDWNVQLPNITHSETIRGRNLFQEPAISSTEILTAKYADKIPVKNLSSLLTHIKTNGKLIWGHSSNSQQTHKMSSHCELAVSIPWVCNSHCEPAVSYLWDHPMSSPWSGSSELTVWVANSWNAHIMFTVWVILWVHCELTQCPHNESTMR